MSDDTLSILHHAAGDRYDGAIETGGQGDANVGWLFTEAVDPPTTSVQCSSFLGSLQCIGSFDVDLASKSKVLIAYQAGTGLDFVFESNGEEDELVFEFNANIPSCTGPSTPIYLGGDGLVPVVAGASGADLTYDPGDSYFILEKCVMVTSTTFRGIFDATRISQVSWAVNLDTPSPAGITPGPTTWQANSDTNRILLKDRFDAGSISLVPAIPVPTAAPAAQPTGAPFLLQEGSPTDAPMAPTAAPVVVLAAMPTRTPTMAPTVLSGPTVDSTLPQPSSAVSSHGGSSCSMLPWILLGTWLARRYML